MRERRLERLFRRYVARGDAQALAKVFDRTAPEVTLIAAHLAGGGSDVELGRAGELVGYG